MSDGIDNFNCSQYGSSETLQDSLNHYSSESEKDVNYSNQKALIGESLPDNIKEDVLTTVSSEEYFFVHSKSRSQAKKLKTITVPKPFKFQTDDRVKEVSSVEETKEFSSLLRQHKPSKQATLNVTKVEPFKLTETKKRKLDDDYYLPLAEQINKFQKKTPDRYHSVSQKEFQPQEHWSPKRLRPRTPNLQAVKRHRAVEVLSREEEEAKVLEEMKVYKFHARPIDPEIYKPTLFETTAKLTTKTKDMQLKTAPRSHARQEETLPETSYRFRARPVPKHILSGPVGIGEKPEITKTKPKSPNFTTEKRLEKRKLLEQQHEVKERPAKKPKATKKSKKRPDHRKKLVKPKLTEIQPFSFDQSDLQRYALKEKRIQEKIEKENKPFIFKAQNLPSSDLSKLPKVKKKPPTKAQPFNLSLCNRNLKQSFSLLSERISFRAQPATVLLKAPFIPEKPAKQSIDFEEFELHTGRRASERMRLKERKDAEEQEKERLQRARKALEEDNERKEILKLRQELVHKANPIRQFKPVEIKPSSIPLTEAKSPDFETNKRIRSKHLK